MDHIITVPQRKAAKLARMRAAVQELRTALATYAKEHGGRFLLFGSAARDEMRPDSDVDLLVDFPADALDAAWSFAERACWDRDLDPDITPFAWCKKPFLDRIAPDLEVLA